ncbi:MAG: glutathione S-transferase family protein [Alphaproteobacteria bacterium]|nr:glutathione S-transferase family protein [Alphaproteobacteria bacterium]
MKFYNSIGPNPHTVRMFAAEKGITLDIREVDVLNSEHRKPPYSAANPMMQTPMLETDDGQPITEITAICEYLEELKPEPHLIGATPGERAETRMWVRRIDLNIVEGRSRAFRATAARAFYRDKIKLLSEPAAEELKLLVEDRIRWLDAQLGAKPFICGARYTLADIMFYCFMTFGALAGGTNLPEGCPNLTAWHTRIAARPAAKA